MSFAEYSAMPLCQLHGLCTTAMTHSELTHTPLGHVFGRRSYGSSRIEGHDSFALPEILMAS